MADKAHYSHYEQQSPSCTTCSNCTAYQAQIRKLELERDLALLTVRQLLTDLDAHHTHQRLEAMGVTGVMS